MLPGNPGATFVCFHELVWPGLARLAGCSRTGLPRVRARLNGELRPRPGRRYLVLAQLHLEPDGFIVTPLPNQRPALVPTCADANAIVLVREGTCDSPPRLGRRDTVDVEVFDCKKALSGSDG